MTQPSQHTLYNPARLRALAASALLDTESEPAFDRFTRAAALLTRAPLAFISLIDADRQFVKSSFGVDLARALKGQTASSSQYCQHVVTNNRTLLLDDTRTHASGIQSYAGAPIHCDGEPIGTLCVVTEQPRQWSAEESEVLETLAAAVDTEIALRMAQSELKARSESSLQDDLTGLQNRRGFMMLGNQALHTAARYGRSLVLLFADLNGLKAVNDELGHEAGDRKIVAMAETMRATFRRADIIARLGGDEFVFLGEAEEAFAETAESKLQTAIEAYNERTPDVYPLSASVGAIARPGGPGATLQELMAAADSRMYSAKRKYKASNRSPA